MNIIHVHHRSQHHASTSGYGRLVDYLESKVVVGRVKFPFRIAKILAGFYAQSKGNYNVGSVLKSIELYHLLRKAKGQKNVVHFLNGERDVRHLSFLKRKFPNTYFCATFHKPPAILKKTIRDVSALKKLDGAIVVGANQEEFIKEWLQLEKVVYIPHGVDTSFFKPAETNSKHKTLLFVGQHLRDFDAFNYCIPKIAKRVTDLKVNVIVHPAYVKKIELNKSVTVFSDVNDTRLLGFYQDASLLFLPLVDVTACNSILEALACGLPIVTTNIGGNVAYLEGTEALLVLGTDNNSYVDSVVHLLQESEKLAGMRTASRAKAKDYSWEHVAATIKEFYNTLN